MVDVLFIFKIRHIINHLLPETKKGTTNPRRLPLCMVFMPACKITRLCYASPFWHYMYFIFISQEVLKLFSGWCGAGGVCGIRYGVWGVSAIFECVSVYAS